VGIDDSVDFHALGPDLAGDSLTQRIVADAAQPLGVDFQAAQSDCHVALRTADTEDQVRNMAQRTDVSASHQRHGLADGGHPGAHVVA
jgi:hypothetical protein